MVAVARILYNSGIACSQSRVWWEALDGRTDQTSVAAGVVRIEDLSHAVVFYRFAWFLWDVYIPLYCRIFVYIRRKKKHNSYYYYYYWPTTVDDENVLWWWCVDTLCNQFSTRLYILCIVCMAYENNVKCGRMGINSSAGPYECTAWRF